MIKWGLSLWERFSLFFLEVISHSSLLGWNASVYCCSASCPKGGLGLWERFRLFFFDVISHSSLLIWNASVYWSMFENNLYIASANVTWSYIMQEEYRLTFLILSKWIICFGGHHNRSKIDQTSIKIWFGSLLAPRSDSGQILLRF